MSRCYPALTAGDMIRLAGEYAAGYLVGDGRYPFPGEFRAGRYTVYHMTDQSVIPDGNSTQIVP